MIAHRQNLPWRLGKLLPLVALLLLTGCPGTPKIVPASGFTFAVASDPHQYATNWYRALKEMRDLDAIPPPALPPVELLLATGDTDPVADRYQDFQAAFKGDLYMKAYLPVKGNHDQTPANCAFLLQLIAQDKRFHPYDATSTSYWVDWKNVRFIVVDTYRGLGESGIVNQTGREWIEAQIIAAPAVIDHIFVAVHQPVFPRHRHVGESFDENPPLRDAFWKMLVKHRDRVRAVFNGHTHFYSRMRVLDPAGKAANDPDQFPDEEGGVLQVDDGSAGKGVRINIVLAHVEGKLVRFRIVDTKAGSGEPFRLVDSWAVQAQ